MKEYLDRYRSHLLLTGLFVFLFHGAKLNSGIVGIDTEDLIFLREDFYGGWLHTGRHGLVLLKHLLGNTVYNPYFTGIVTLLMFTLAVAAFLSLWDWGFGTRTGIWGWAFGGLLWISHPAMVEQFYFSLQSMEICMAFALTALALYLSFRWGGSRRPAWAVGSVGILLLTFSCYQAFVTLYIFGTVALLLLQALGEVSEGKEATRKELLKRVMAHFALFIAAFLLNIFVTRLLFGSSDYLSNQIAWGNVSVKDCLRDIAAHVFKAFTGYHSIFYSAGLGSLALLDLILLVVFLMKRRAKAKGVFAMIVFLYLALLVTPFMMTFVLGHTPAMRSQLVLPGLTGFLAYLGMAFLQPHEEGERRGRQFIAVFGCASAICFVTGMGQAKVTGSLYYTDSCRNEQDAALGRSIMERMEQVNPGHDAFPAIVIGGREFRGNRSCVMGEIIGRSFFDYDRDVEPKGYWSTKRALGFLHTLGADYDRVPEEWVGEAVECSADMPIWPAEGSVQVRNGMLIIKLSEN